MRPGVALSTPLEVGGRRNDSKKVVTDVIGVVGTGGHVVISGVTSSGKSSLLQL